jgi:DNA-binding SARP family transcriptional activator
VEFRVLGPIEALVEGRPTRLGGPKERAVLALLLLRANEVVPRDRLIDDLWGERAPRTAVDVLYTYLSHLRVALGNDVLLTRPPGYLLVVGQDELDLRRFEQLVERGADSLRSGAAADAAQTLREALALWRGPPLADVAGEAFAAPEVARLEELRAAALELRVEADLALGRHLELVGEIEALVREHPLRERLRGQLMLALYRSGRQADALEAYREARRALVDELGIEPSVVLQELERAVLRHDPALDTRPAETHAVPERSLLVVSRSDAAVDGLLRLAVSLAGRPSREVVVVRLLPPGDDVAEASRRLVERREALVGRGVESRVAAFTSESPGGDVVRLATVHEADLLLLDAPPELLVDAPPAGDVLTVLAGAPCDVAYLAGRPLPDLEGPALVPFGGSEHDWAALELAAWLASGTGAPLTVLGTEELGEGGRDASRLLASASLIVQQVAGIVAEPRLVSRGPAAIVEAARDAAVLVVGVSERWRSEGLGPARLAVAREARPPVLLVRRGIRPGGLSPRETLTRFTWTLGGS